ncbi:related to Palmitoyltransferase erf2 [Ramularia collo-cygni]|uniref:Palmitoyltransferase n=1 Tax=Ramularia collo-cygni TaxID=112498 RepID=A0A2D3USX6_9PEZI|nr:related to Palmitoyltransferase erf2 [Ramularia collo-cygni]CZT14837.1 related to Palmitoyltransferase erf2 [Ramularia collo-cygni]
MSTLLSATTSNDDRPPTASSNDTDLHSTNGNATSVAPSAGPVGEPGLPPSRQTDGARGSRRGYAAFGGARPRSSRPESATNSTHVPMANTTFFRPMSSQKLQAQRGQTVVQPITEDRQDGVKKGRMRSHRNSDASVHTMRAVGRVEEDAPPPLPVSRGGYSVATSAGGAPIGGSMDSTAALDLRTPRQREQDEKAAQKKRLGLGLAVGSRHSSRLEVHHSPHLDSHPDSESTTQEKRPYDTPPKMMGRNYEYFGGNMLFFFLGRCMNTRAKPLNILTFILAVFPAALFAIFSAPYLWRNVSPALPIIFAYVFLLTLSSFLHAAFSDPGILPRNLHPHPELESDRDPLAIGPPSTEWVMVKTFPSQQKNLESSAEQGQHTTAMEVPTKYCKTCQIWRPPRTHHCRICDACMETQDHHCVWLNNCVGRRNYRYFFAFVGMGSIMALLLIAFSAVHVQHYASANDIGFGNALTGRTQEKVAFAMMIYALFALPYPGSLCVYHLFLVGRGETTREYLNGHKFLPVDRHRPFSLGSRWKNWTAVLLRPRGPSYLSFKRRYLEGDVRLGHGQRKKDRRREEKREAVEQKSRVEGLKQRFTVGNGSPVRDGEGEKKEGVEMKQLNGGAVHGPPNTANGGGNGRPAVGRLNSTPRLGAGGGGGEKLN